MFTIKSTRLEGETLYATTEFTLKDDSVVQIEVPIFAPADKDAVNVALASREDTENSKLDIKSNNESIKAELDNNLNVSYAKDTTGKISVLSKVSSKNISA